MWMVEWMVRRCKSRGDVNRFELSLEVGRCYVDICGYTSVSSRRAHALMWLARMSFVRRFDEEILRYPCETIEGAT